MEFPKYIEQAIEDIDSSLFSGDVFHEKEALSELKTYLDRWSRRCAEIENTISKENV